MRIPQEPGGRDLKESTCERMEGGGEFGEIANIKPGLHQSCMSPDTAQDSEQQDSATVPEGGPAAETPSKAESENTKSSESGTHPRAWPK